MLVNKSISNGKTTLPYENSSFIWLKLNKSFFKLQNDVYICFLHIPPKNSSFTQKNWDGFEVLVNSARKYSSVGDLLVIGDFNARTGRAADFITSDSDADYATYDIQYSPDLKCDIRNSEDEIICSRGRDLLDLCIQSKMRILNGRMLGDLSGKLTSHCSLGSSVIDYCICSDKLLSKILSMKVHDFDRSLSNHCMLSCIISVNFVEHRPELDNLYPLPFKYAWNSSSIEKFQNALQSAPVAAKVSHFYQKIVLAFVIWNVLFMI